MKRYESAMRIRQITVPIVIMASLAVSARAQGICVHEQLIANSLNGRVVAQLTKGESPIGRASVVLLEDRYQGRVVAQATSDTDGVFKFNKKIRPGKYILKVTYPNLATYYGPVKLVKPEGGSPPQEIVVTIGADFNRPCGGSSAEVRVKKTV